MAKVKEELGVFGAFVVVLILMGLLALAADQLHILPHF